MLRRARADPNLFGGPAPCKLLDGRNVDGPVMEVALQIRQPPRHEAPVLTDRVAAHRAFAFGHEAAENLQEDLGGGLFVESAIELGLRKA